MIIFLLQLLLLIPVGSFHSMGAGKGISHVAMIKISRSARLPSFANSNSDADILSTREAIKSTLTNTAQSIIAASAVVFTSYLKPALALPLRSDEFNVEIKTEFLGLSLAEIKVDDATLVTVQSIRDDADPLLKESIRPGMIIIAIGENPVEGYSGKEVVNLFKSISKPTQLTFRDPTLFFDNLNTTKALGIAAGLSAGSVTVGVRGGGVVDTMINFATNETLRVQRLNVSAIKIIATIATINMRYSYTCILFKYLCNYFVAGGVDGQFPVGECGGRCGGGILDSGNGEKGRGQRCD